MARAPTILTSVLGLLAAGTPSGAGFPVTTYYDSPAAQVQGAVLSVLNTGGGSLLVGADQLAAYDGDRWAIIETPPAYAFRALAAGKSGRRVYVGASNLLGFADRTESGQWQFTSLTGKAATAAKAELGDVWSVFVLSPRSAGGAGTRIAGPNGAPGNEETVVWVASQSVLRWTAATGEFEAWPLKASPKLWAFADGNSVLIYQHGAGLLRLGAEGPPRMVVPEKDLPGLPVTWFAGGLIGIDEDAYRWDGMNGFERLAPLSAELQGTLPVTAVVLNPDTVAIGTFKGGLVLASPDGAVRAHWQGGKGVDDNSEYSLTADAAGHLWAGLGSGFVRLDAPDRVALFDSRNGLEGGGVRRVVTLNGETYVLTPQFCYNVGFASRPDRLLGAELAPVLLNQGFLWDAAAFSGRTWVGGLGTIWRVSSSEAEQVLAIPEDVLQVAQSRFYPDGLIFLQRNALKALFPSPHGGWAVQDLGSKVNDTPVSLVEDRDGKVWVSTMLDGITSFAWRDQGDQHPILREEGHFVNGTGLKAGVKQPVLAEIDGHLVVFTSEDVLVYEPERGLFEPARGLEDFIGVAASHEGYWAVRKKGSLLFSILKVSPARGAGNPPSPAFAWQPIAVPGLDKVGDLTAIESDGQTLWIGGKRGLLGVKISALRPAPTPPSVELRPYHWDETARHIEFSYPAGVTEESLSYQTRLGLIEKAWSAPLRQPERVFTGLTPGHYQFAARSLDRFGRTGTEAIYSFSVPSPWWTTWPAFVCYGLALALAVAGVIKWRLVRLRILNVRLNRLVTDRTRELELSNTAKSEFLENVSHEIRNPLAGLSGLIRRLREDRMDPEEQELARSLKAATEHLTRVCEEVLGFSKLEYGYVKVGKKLFLMRKLVEGIRDLYAPAAAQSANRIALEFPPDFTDGFLGDEGKILTIVSNFVVNAIKYAPGKPVEIKVECLPTEAGEDMAEVTIEVSDFGPGVPEKDQDYIFQKFVRGSNAKKDGVAGTGLGLATANILATAMNASVGLENRPGKGATFFLRMFLRRMAAAPSAEAVNAASEGEGSVLIVEDEVYNQTVLKGIARDLGYAPTIANNAGEAFARMSEQPFSVIFLDWELPGLKGGDIARQIRAREDGQGPIIVATTAHDSEEMRERCLQAGMDEFLLKPYETERVRHALALVRARRNGQPEPVALAPRPASGGLDFNAFTLYGRAEPAMAAEAVAIYRESLNEELASVKRASESRDTEATKRAAHRTRGLAALINARQVMEMAEQLEKRASMATEEESSELLTRLATALEELKSKLDQS
jgi:signal transduction histidine kinase/DNA-binding response OmpR family regulator